MLEYISNYLTMIVIILFLVGFFIIDLLFRKKIKKLKNEINKKYSEEELEEIENIDILDQDLYIEYYKEKNILNLLRFIILFSLLISLILYKVPGVFSFLAIAVGAIIITFKELLLSFFGFFYISTHYRIGENIVLGDVNNITRGEIIYINILNIGIVGKNENGEHNGQFYTIPNFKLIVENTRKEEIGINKYRKEEIEVYFKNQLFDLNFEEFLEKLKEFLDSELSRKNINNVGNYKTYIGTKYKLRFKYDKDYLIVKIFFVEKPRIILDIQKKVTLFVESHKKANEIKS